DGKPVGVFGVDVTLDGLQSLAAGANQALYDGQGSVGVLSTLGILAAHSGQATRLGQRFDAADAASDLPQRIAEERPLVRQRGDTIQVIHPFAPIPEAQPWAVMLEVPQQLMLAPVLNLERQLDQRRVSDSLVSLALGLLATVVGLLLIWFTARSVTRPILAVADMRSEEHTSELQSREKLV